MSEHHHELQGRSLVITIFLNVAITLAQVIGAVYSHSLSLLTDALHNFSDVMALFISYIANKLSKREYTAEKSYGYKRAEILAAFINAATLLAVSAYLIIESVQRFLSNQEALVDGNIVAILAGFSILANGASVLIIKRFSKQSMNMRSAYLHLFSDMLSSVAVLLGGLAMQFWEIIWIDALLSVIIALYLIVSSWKLFVKTVRVLMQFTPTGVDINHIASYVGGLKGVKNMHHVHVWQLTDNEYHLEGHIDFEEDVSISGANEIMKCIEQELYANYHINHCTLQPEYNVDDNKGLIGENKFIGHRHQK